MPVKNIKIGFLLPGLGFVRRGAEQAFIELGKELAKKSGLEVLFFGGGDLKINNTRFIKTPLIKRYCFERFPKIPFFRNSSFYEEFFYSISLLFKLLKNPCDVYIACSYPYIFLTLRILKKIFRRKFKLYYSTQNGIWFTKKIKEGKLFFCDAIFCTNPVYLEELKRLYPAILTPNGFDAALWNEKFYGSQYPEIRERIHNAEKNILCVAALVKEKKLDLIIKAVTGLKNCKLIIVGDGPEFNELKKLADKAAFGNVTLVGSVSHEEIIRYYKEAGLFISMKEEEPFALVFSEAMASGVPIIAYDNPIHRWAIGEAGIYLKPKAPDELRECIAQALNLPDLTERSAALKHRAFGEFTWQKTAETIYNFIIKERINGADSIS